MIRNVQILKIIFVGILITFAFTFTSCSNVSEQQIPEYIASGEYNNVVEAYNKCVAGNIEKENKYKPVIEDAITEVISAWSAGEMEFDYAISSLNTMVEIDCKELSKLAKNDADFISIENEGNVLESEAEELFQNKKYEKAYENLSNIDKKYSGYDDVKIFSNECRDILLALISYPTSKEEYDTCMNKCDVYFEINSDNVFMKRKQQMIDEEEAFKESIELINLAEDNFEKSNYKKAFESLSSACDENPDNKFYSEALNDLKITYIVIISKQISALVDQKEYSKALDIVADAKTNYDCAEFNDLEKYIKEERNPLRKIGRSIVDKIKSTSEKWQEENYTVEQAGKDAGAYIVKSGKKLVLGDYTKDEITVLSFGGDVVTSVIGVDALLNFRDLSYDIVNWSEDEYFLVNLGVDLVALIPVIGVVKHIDKVKYATKTVENAQDAINNGSKGAKIINEMADKASSLSKNSDQTSIIGKNLIKHRTKVHTINESLVGKKHPETGVEFMEKKLNYSDGQRIAGVFPKFDSRIDLQLPKELYKLSEKNQKKWLLARLQNEIKRGNLKEVFTEAERETILKGKIPKGYTWHHNEKEGLMQLVDSEIHEKTRHTGGMSLWGKGYKNKAINN